MKTLKTLTVATALLAGATSLAMAQMSNPPANSGGSGGGGVASQSGQTNHAQNGMETNKKPSTKAGQSGTSTQ